MRLISPPCQPDMFLSTCTSSQTHLYILPAEFAIYTPFLASLFIRRPSQSKPYCRSVYLIRNLCMLFAASLFSAAPSQSNPYCRSVCLIRNLIYTIPCKPFFPSFQPSKPIFATLSAELEILTLLFVAFVYQFFKHLHSRSFKRLSSHDTGVHLGTSRACWPHFLAKDQFPSNLSKTDNAMQCEHGTEQSAHT